jgi:phospholipid-binding lipoprotein MlaA
VESVSDQLHRVGAAVGALLLCAALSLAGAPRALAAEITTAAEDALLAELDTDGADGEIFDPLEPVNRKTLSSNQGLQRWFLSPITKTYAFIVPAPARRAVLRAFDNLNAPAVAINDLLQREWKDAGVTVIRFTLNTTVGLAGFFDPAEKIGLPGHESDFGQTLALAGMPSGPYLMLPLIGPTTARDGTGYIVDFFFRPTTWLLPFADQLFYTSIREGSFGLAMMESQSAGLHMLEESSIDFYAALRSAYLQKRTGQIWARREHHRTVLVAAADPPAVNAAPLVADAAQALTSPVAGTGR